MPSRRVLLGLAAAAPLVLQACSGEPGNQAGPRPKQKNRARSGAPAGSMPLGRRPAPTATRELERGFAPSEAPQSAARADSRRLSGGPSNESRFTRQLGDPNIHEALRFTPSPFPQGFRWNHADTLLAAAHFLLTRCMDARSEWQDKYLKFHTFLFELEQFEALDRIHRLETEAGFYDVEAAMASAEYRAGAEMLRNLDQATGMMHQSLNKMQSEEWKQTIAHTILGWLSHISAYPTEGDSVRHAIFNGVDKTVLEHCKDESFNIAAFNLSNEISRTWSDYLTKSGDLHSLLARLEGVRTKRDWETRNRAFRESRTAALRELFQRKRALLADPTSGLDFRSQLQAALGRCQRDFSDGLAHAEASSRGLQTIFGYPNELPRSVRNLVRGSTRARSPGQALDDAVAWARDAASWLSQFSQRDGMQIPCFSIRRLVSRGAWTRFKDSGQLSFSVPEDVFPGQSNVRFRGATLHVVGEKGVFGGSLTVPSSSFFRMPDGRTNRVNQSDVPTLRFGSIREFDSPRAPEVVGGAVAYNVAPIGSWILSVSELSTAGERLGGINDILFELAVASRS
jgi:hypothetical protein